MERSTIEDPPSEMVRDPLPLPFEMLPPDFLLSELHSWSPPVRPLACQCQNTRPEYTYPEREILLMLLFSV